MRTLLMLWLGPIAFFWSWYFLAANDLSFGVFFLTRAMHDEVFDLYSGILGVPPEVIPGMVAKTLFFDSFIVLGIIAWRKRKPIATLVRRVRSGQPALPISAESLSKAP